MQLPVYVIIVQLPQVIGKPLVPDSEEPEESGLPGSLAAHQTEHDLKLRPRLEYPCHRPQHEQQEDFIIVIAHLRTEEMAQGIAHPLRPVPLQAVQVITDRVIPVFIGGYLDSPLNPLL